MKSAINSTTRRTTKAGWNTDACEQTLLYLNAHKNVLNFFSKLIFQLTMLIWNSWTEQELHNLIQKKKQKRWVSSFVKKKPQITFPFYCTRGYILGALYTTTVSWSFPVVKDCKILTKRLRNCHFKIFRSGWFSHHPVACVHVIKLNRMKKKFSNQF